MSWIHWIHWRQWIQALLWIQRTAAPGGTDLPLDPLDHCRTDPRPTESLEGEITSPGSDSSGSSGSKRDQEKRDAKNSWIHWKSDLLVRNGSSGSGSEVQP